MVYLFRKLTEPYSAEDFPEEILFTQNTVREAMEKAIRDGVIDKAVANVPDIKYTYDARRDLPEEVEQAGPMTWLQSGKGAYILRRTRRRNIIQFPEHLAAPPELEFHPDHTPPFIASLFGKDEQAVFTRVRNAGLIDIIVGAKAWPIRGHHRTTVSYGQIEVDEVQAAPKLARRRCGNRRLRSHRASLAPGGGVTFGRR